MSSGRVRSAGSLDMWCVVMQSRHCYLFYGKAGAVLPTDDRVKTVKRDLTQTEC